MSWTRKSRARPAQKYLQAPWRWNFITGSHSQSGCLFCQAPKGSDEEGLILWRGKDFYTILNKYPYTSGHLMIAPYRHIDRPDRLAADLAPEMWSALQSAIAALDECFNPQGYNLGMNVGEASGAGIKGHIHFHVVPRWSGDASFMSIVGGVTVASYDLAAIYRQLRDVLARSS